jgi:hypothetical protein
VLHQPHSSPLHQLALVLQSEAEVAVLLQVRLQPMLQAMSLHLHLEPLLVLEQLPLLKVKFVILHYSLLLVIMYALFTPQAVTSVT